MASKKMKRAIMLGLAGAALMGGSKTKAAANVDSGRGGNTASSMARKMANSKKSVFKDAIMRGGKGAKSSSIGMGDKIKNFLSDEIFTRNPKSKAFTIPKTPGSNFGMGAMDGAKTGKMIKAKTGVMARGCKLGKKKRTIIT